MKDMSITLALLINACGLFVIAAALGARPGPECTAGPHEWESVEPAPLAEMPEVSR